MGLRPQIMKIAPPFMEAWAARLVLRSRVFLEFARRDGDDGNSGKRERGDWRRINKE